jgi:hypothetical protein
MIIKITPDKERAKMILNRVYERESFISKTDFNEFSSIGAENYYELIKELITALMLLEGFKTTGENAHKELIELLSETKKFNKEEIEIIDDLRIKRNKLLYEGKAIENIYIKNKKYKLEEIINKLKKILEKELKGDRVQELAD